MPDTCGGTPFRPVPAEFNHCMPRLLMPYLRCVKVVVCFKFVYTCMLLLLLCPINFLCC